MIYKVGIIGYGKMGIIRHEAIKGNKFSKLVAISDPDLLGNPDNIPNISQTEIIKREDIDIVIVCTPNYLNKELTISLLRAGKHVFCEKPPCFTEAEMKEIRIVEKENDKLKLMYGFNHRHHDSIIRIKKIVDEGQLGKILWMRGRYGKSVTADYFDQWRAKKELAGGGILIDQGIHMLDLFLYFGGSFDSVKAEVSNLYWNLEVEDNAFAILKNTKTGLVASLHSTMTQWRHLFSLEIFLEKGSMVLNGLVTSSMSYGEEILTITKNRSASPAAEWEDEINAQYTDNHSWRYEMEHFINAIKYDTPIMIGNSNDAIKLMAIIDEIYKSKDF